MAALHGPELPLELFVKDAQRPQSMKGREWDQYRVKRMEEFCTNPKYTAHSPPLCAAPTALSVHVHTAMPLTLSLSLSL